MAANKHELLCTVSQIRSRFLIHEGHLHGKSGHEGWRDGGISHADHTHTSATADTQHLLSYEMGVDDSSDFPW